MGSLAVIAAGKRIGVTYIQKKDYRSTGMLFTR